MYSPIAKGSFCVLFAKTDSSASTLGILVSQLLTSVRKPTEILQNNFLAKMEKENLAMLKLL